MAGPFGLEFYVGVPLKTYDGHVLGMLSCMDTRPRGVTPRQLRYLETLAAIVMDEIELRRSACQISRLSEALADACTDLERRASFDPLTGVLARSALLERGAPLIERALQGPKGAALLMLDIDRFKDINDTYGHAIGDRVLKEVAGRMAASCRAGDLLGRIGGEEFLAVFPDVTEPEAAMIADRLREAVGRRRCRSAAARRWRSRSAAGWWRWSRATSWRWRRRCRGRTRRSMPRRPPGATG